MAQLVGLNDAAKLLGVSPERLVEMRSRGEISGYRDGTSWKFKQSEIERVASIMRDDGSDSDSREVVDLPLDDDSREIVSLDDLDIGDDSVESVLVSEHELGRSDDATSSTIIGASERGASDEADIQVASDDSDHDRMAFGGGSDLGLTSEKSDVLSGSPKPAARKSPSTHGSNLLDEIAKDLSESSLKLAAESSPKVGKGAAAKAAPPPEDEDDEFVLGGGDITLDASDSGINLASPSDSGLLLEGQAFELSEDESLELGDEQLLSLEEAGGDDEFLLTPVESADSSDDGGDSGSQVIELDASDLSDVDEAAPLLETDALEMADDAGPAIDLEQPALAPLPMAVSSASDSSFSMPNVVLLSVTALLLTVTGMMMTDIVRSMWSWQEPFSINSSMMDALTGMLTGG